ncbi:uncharacterized protein LOC129720257 [Wyeomyia smithii]|uniref:uncharacterized protein LOC129720257 n=1 Tax=Wyeomyia smithii TaxID=174621 RepID=UPI0024681D20|nr:uncharacterized protein LOC129720257 [Wyeomyia smithii]
MIYGGMDPTFCVPRLIIGLTSRCHFQKTFKLMKKPNVWCHYIFYKNCRASRELRLVVPLTPEEFDYSLKILIRITQRSSFPAEIRRFTKDKPSTNIVNSGMKSSLLNLNLFMDEFGLLRIEGRLRYSNAPFDTRFPILLPAKHKLSLLIARVIHLRTLHGGPTLLLATMRQRYWPLRGRDLARKVVRQCITCFQCHPKPATQIMGPLPAVRITPARPFTYTGMDYCGPFFVRSLYGRGASVKMYVGLFVCLVVKAAHLEIVAELSSASCINAVKRVVARRGRITEIHCDNATALVGADRELQQSRNELIKQLKGDQWRHHCIDNGIKFRFIPARSPHFYGLWEAGIKSFKHHFRRITGQRAFSVDQFHTVVTQVEAVLNSRPLSQMSDSPDDFNVITPGHFLIGGSLVSISEPDLSHINPGHLDRLQHMKKSHQDLWARWSLA